MIMTEQKFKQYETEFNNAHDKSDFYDHWFHPNAEFIHPIKGTFRGKEQLVNFWNCGEDSGHAGIREKLNLVNFLAIENKFSAELDIEWTCFEDTNYLGVRKQGDVFYGKCAAFYTMEGDKIVKVSLYLNLVDNEADKSI